MAQVMRISGEVQDGELIDNETAMITATGEEIVVVYRAMYGDLIHIYIEI